MTATLERPSPELETLTSEEVEPAAVAEQALLPMPLRRMAVAGGLATAAGAWPVSQLFRTPYLALAFCLLGATVGLTCSYLGAERSRAWVSYVNLPLALMLGSVVVAASASGKPNVLLLVREAVDRGGLAQAPIALVPGWRFLLVVVFAAVSGTGLALGLGLRQPRIAILAAAGPTLGAMLLQPKGSELETSAVAAFFLIAAQTVASGADLAARGIADATFELRRLRRGGIMLAAIIAALALVSQTSFLFPATKTDNVVPPRKPPIPPPLPDHELFRVNSSAALVWRVGVLDGYGDNALLLPAFDPRRIRSVNSDGDIGGKHPDGVPTSTVTVTVGALPGETLPVPAQATKVTRLHHLDEDPRTLVVSLHDGRVESGSRYDVTVLAPPTTKELSSEPDAPAGVRSEYTRLPAVPPGVAKVLAAAPRAPMVERLQYVRQALYSHVIAAGAGKPTDVTPDQVDQMLAGGDATPYQIVAGEVMIARWAGIPARMGFGFTGGRVLPDSAGRAFHPTDGSAWLEAYFGNRGWVPLLGVPPKAKASLSSKPKKSDPRVVASQNLALTVYVPIHESSIRQAYLLARYYVAVALPFALALIAMYLSLPFLAKVRRRAKRQRWAAQRGPAGRVLASYAEFRDAMHDLNVGWAHASALEFVADIDDDDEHLEFAWLYSRALYGDLTRGLTDDDAARAAEMEASLTRRVRAAETGTNRLIAWLARSSLRDPFTRDLPNAWPTPAALRPPKQSRRRVRRAAASPSLGVVVAFCLAVLSMSGCALSTPRADTPVAPLPSPLPSSLDGLRLQPEPIAETKYAAAGPKALAASGMVFTVHDGTTVQGSVQIQLLKSEYRSQDRPLQEQLIRGLALGTFSTVHYGVLRLATSSSFRLHTWVWFPADRNVMELFVMREEFAGAEHFVHAAISSQLGWPMPGPEPFAIPSGPADPAAGPLTDSPTPSIEPTPTVGSTP